jgi:adenylosuccinate lyase
MQYDSVTYPMDMFLYRDKFGTPAMRKLWSEENIIAKRLEVEAVLAETQAELGMIPHEAAKEIRKKANIEYVKPEKYAELYAIKGHDIVALVWALAEVCDDGWGEYVHWRSTTQDILWTSNVLIIKESIKLLLDELRETEGLLLDLMEKHKLTIMPGRTHGQHCPPITFGFYLGILGYAVRRHIERMKECRGRLMVGKLTGAVGTASSYGPPELAMKLQTGVCEKLDLGVPPITESEITRDRVAEFLNVLAMVSTNMEKLARDIWNQQRPEIDELAEPFRTGEQVGSSTCAHKRNPFACEWIMGTAKMVRAHAYPVNELYCMDVRDGSRLAVEYTAVPACCLMTSAILQGISYILKGLTVKPENMRRNVLMSQGLCMDESVMLVLAEKIGRQSAHDLVYKCSMKAFEESRSLKETLLETPTVTKYLTSEQIEELTVPENYLGTAAHQVEDTIKIIREARKKDR